MNQPQNNYPGPEWQQPQTQQQHFPQPPEAPRKRKRKRLKIAGIIAGSVLTPIILVGGLSGCGTGAPDTITDQPATGAPSQPKPTEPTERPTPKATEQPTDTQMTTSQKQAVRAAENYIETMPFSKKGLIKQLVYEKFSEADATFAANHIDVDWKEQAVKKAQSYLETMPFSQADLVDQLKYEGFTQAQAEHGAAVAFDE